MQYFEFNDDKSSKFWAIEVLGDTLNLKWGKIGTAGQSKSKSYLSEDKANEAKNKLIKEKLGKGYVEQIASSNQNLTDNLETRNLKKAKTIKDASAKDITPSKVVDENLVPKSLDKVAKTGAQNNKQFIAHTETDNISADTQALHDLVINGDKSIAPWLRVNSIVDLPNELLKYKFVSRADPAEKLNKDALFYWKTCLKNLGEFKLVDTPKAWQSAANEAINRLADHEMIGSFESDVILFLFFAARNESREKASVAFVQHLVAKKDIIYAIDVLITAQTLEINLLSNNYYQFSIVEATRSLLNGHVFCFHELYYRELLSNCTSNEWSICANKLKAALETIIPIRKPLVAFLLPEWPEISNSLTFELCEVAKKQDSFSTCTLGWLKLTCDDPKALEINSEFQIFPYYSQPMYIKHLSLQVLMAILAKYPMNDDNIKLLTMEQRLHVLPDVLSYIGLPEAIKTLISYSIEDKSHFNTLEAAIQKWPIASIKAFVDIIDNPKLNTPEHSDYISISKTYLKRLLIDYLPIINEYKTWVSEEAFVSVIELINSMNPVVDTSLGSITEIIPEILVNPPWLKGHTGLSVEAMKLALLSDEPVVNVPNKISYRENYSRLAGLFDGTNYLNHDAAKKIITFFFPEKIIEQAFDALINKDVKTFATLFYKGLDIYFLSYRRTDIFEYVTDEFALEIFNKNPKLFDNRIQSLMFRFGTQGLDAFIEITQAKPSDTVQLWKYIGAAKLAPYIAKAYAKLKLYRDAARAWLIQYPKHAAIGLIPMALGKENEECNHARIALRLLANNGFKNEVFEIAKRYDDEKVMNALDIIINQNQANIFPKNLPEMPFFWQPQFWHPLRLKDSNHPLPLKVIDNIGTMLAISLPESTYVGLEVLKEICDKQSLGKFVCDLFESWVAIKMPKHSDWVMSALSILGDDETARHLVPYIRQWPAVAQHGRATEALDILKNINSDVSLILLNNIAQKIKYPALKNKANEKIALMAIEKGLTVDELEDRIIPDFGFDQQGIIVLDFGPRQFNVLFNEHLQLTLTTIDNTVLKNLPKPNKNDDELMALQAIEAFKLLKKDTKMLVEQQTRRLEKAMVDARRWDIDTFKTILLNHPFMRHFVQKLVWGVYQTDIENTTETLLNVFRVASEGNFMNEFDEDYQLPEFEHTRIGIIHPLELNDDVITAFKQIFADYQIFQPFDQLNRSIHFFTEDELNTNRIDRFAAQKTNNGALIGLLKQGWQKHESARGAEITMQKLINEEYAFCIELDKGIEMYDFDPEQYNHITQLIINHRQQYFIEEDQRPKFSIINKIALSECLRDLDKLFKV